jgi:subtilisin family serine protease
MKSRLLFLIAMLVSFTACAQVIPPKDIPKEYRAEYRDDIRDYERFLKREADEWDIVLPIEEAIGVPSVADFTNWGKEQLLPDAVYQKLLNAWEYPVVVKIFDTSQEYYHNDLKKAAIKGSDYTGDNTPQIDQGHGIHVGGIVAGERGGIAYAGVAKGLLKLKPVQVLNDGGSGSFSWVANGIKTEDIDNKKLIESGTGVACNYSLGGGTSLVSAVEAAFKSSNELGVIHVAANGNTGGAVNYPGKSDYTFGVSSLDQNLKISSYSSRGIETDYTAPGRGINSTYKGQGYATLSGTSMATPFVTGLVANALGVWGTEKLPNQSAVQAYFDWISTDLGDAGKDDLYGEGLTYVIAIIENDPADNPNNGTPPPAPPTCDDGKQNGKETGVDCGGDCPPCDDEPGYPGVEFPERIITVRLNAKELNASWRGLWVEATGASGEDVKSSSFSYDSFIGVNEDGKDVFALTSFPTAQRKYGWITFDEWEVRIKTKKSAEMTVNELKKAIDNTWNGRRGVGIETPGDFASGALWMAYFTDLLLERNEGLDITISKITFNNEKGQYLSYVSNDLPQWPRDSDPFDDRDYSYDFHLDLDGDGVYRYNEDKDKEPPTKRPRLYEITASWSTTNDVPIKLEQPGLPTYEGSILVPDEVGIYTYTIKHSTYPTDEVIESRPPFRPYSDGWKLKEVIKIKQLK